MTETVLSQDAFARLSAELEDLTSRGRVEVARAIEAARALGDLSENGDYHAARDAQGKMEARIRQLQGLLGSARVLDGSSSPQGVVGAGTVVGLRFEGDLDVERYLVGSIEERRDGLAVVSLDSPLGKALRGRAAGETLEYQASGSTIRVELVAIES